MSFQQPAEPLSANTLSRLAETIGLVVTAVSAALFASGSFLVLALGFLMALGARMGVPSWLIVGMGAFVALAGLRIAIWIFKRTLEVERSLSHGTYGLAVLSEDTVVDARAVFEDPPDSPRQELHLCSGVG